jgi:hypothetical protein
MQQYQRVYIDVPQTAWDDAGALFKEWSRAGPQFGKLTGHSLGLP